jgi:hypothetical protein
LLPPIISIRFGFPGGELAGAEGGEVLGADFGGGLCGRPAVVLAGRTCAAEALAEGSRIGEEAARLAGAAADFFAGGASTWDGGSGGAGSSAASAGAGKAMRGGDFRIGGSSSLTGPASASTGAGNVDAKPRLIKASAIAPAPIASHVLRGKSMGVSPGIASAESLSTAALDPSFNSPGGRRTAARASEDPAAPARSTPATLTVGRAISTVPPRAMRSGPFAPRLARSAGSPALPRGEVPGAAFAPAAGLMSAARARA